jgi:hypothetical protein
MGIEKLAVKDYTSRKILVVRQKEKQRVVDSLLNLARITPGEWRSATSSLYAY